MTRHGNVKVNEVNNATYLIPRKCTIYCCVVTVMEADSLSKLMSNWSCAQLLTDHPTDELAVDTPGHLLRKRWVIPVKRFGPGAVCQDRLDLAACSTFPQPSSHSLPLSDHQTSPYKKDMSLHIFHSDGLLNSPTAGQWNLPLKELRGSLKENGLANHLQMASLKSNINPVHLLCPILSCTHFWLLLQLCGFVRQKLKMNA